MSLETDHDPLAVVRHDFDGVPVPRSTAIHLEYRQTISEHEHLLTDLDMAVDRLPHRFAAVVPSRCDAVGAIVRMAGLPIRQAERDRSIGAIAPVIVAGCSRNLPGYLPTGFFERGGVLVTSGRSILDVPLPRGLLTTGRPCGPATVRIDVEEAGLPVSLPVRLPAGHIPVRLPDPGDPRIGVIASAHATGDPIVVAARIGAGWLLHSVAHWFQEEAPSTRFIIDRRHNREWIEPVPVQHGLDDAVRAMSLALLSGLRLVLRSHREISKL